jgi:thiamine biosynthesis lipoprotein
MLNSNSSAPAIHRRLVSVLDNPFEISVVGSDEQWADEKINSATAEINRVLEMLSIGNLANPINQINLNAGVRPVKVDPEIFNLVTRALKISELTKGAFDITCAHIVDPAKHANYQNITLDPKNGTIFLKQPGMCIGLDRILNGYATDRAKYVLQMQGVSSGIVNAFGEMITWGRQPDDKPWTVEAADPGQKLQMFAGLNISNMALSTADNNQSYPAIGGKNLKHKTGFPWRSIKSVSVLSQSAEMAAAMSAPVMVMGTKLSLNLFNKLNQLVCVIVNNRKKVYTSKSINMMMC